MHLLNDKKFGSNLVKDQKPPINLLFMDDLKLYAIKWASLINTMRISFLLIRMYFELDECAVLKMKKKQKVDNTVTELSNGESLKIYIINTWEY